MRNEVTPYTRVEAGLEGESAPIAASAEGPIISLQRVSKRFEQVIALYNVSLNIRQGEVFGLLGPNGAGKSTLLKLLLGFLRPDEGKIRLFGASDLTKAHARLGYLSEQSRYHGNFSGREYLRFHAGLSGLGAREARIVADASLEAVGLLPDARRLIRSYSKGMRRRLGLAVALSSAGGKPPELLILDEPSSGLDVEGQLTVREVIVDCKRRGSTVLLCSHELTEVERVCSAVGILRSGRLVTTTSLDEHPRVRIEGLPRTGALEIAPRLMAYLKTLHPEVTVIGGPAEGQPLVVTLPTGAAMPGAEALKAVALRAMIDAQWDITSVHVENKDLETLYMQAVHPAHEQKDQDRADGARKAKEKRGSVPARLSPSPLAQATTEPGAPIPEQSTISEKR